MDHLVLNEGAVRSVAFSRDGAILVAGHTGGGRVAGVVLWEVGTWKCLVNGHLIVPEGIVQSVALTSDPTTLAAGYSIGSSGGVVLWDVI